MKKPYTLEPAQATAKTPTNALWRASSAYASTIAETATAPRTFIRIA